MNRIKMLCLGLLCCLVLSGVAGAEEPMRMVGYDAQAGREWESSLFFERMAQETGVSFTFLQFTEAEAYAKEKAGWTADGVQPDVLFKAELTPQEELALAESGVLMDLAPLLAEHAPNLSALLEAHPAWREAITLPDGKIVALPTLTEAPRQVTIWLNRVWMDKLGLEMPTDTTELTALLQAFSQNDLNENGRQDEVPLLLIGTWEAKWFLHAFGINADDYNCYLDEGGQVRFAPDQPAYYDYLAYMKSLHDGGLIYEDAFRQSHSMVDMTEQENKELRFGGLISFAPYTLVDVDVAAQFDALPPLTYEGKRVYRDFLGPVWRGTFALTSACKDPAAALRWVDTLYTEEGARLAHMGLEGQEWDYVEAPYWNFILDEYRPYNQVSNEALISDSAMVPGIDPSSMWETVDNFAERHIIEQNAVVAQVARQAMPLLYPDAAQWAEIGELQEAVGTHVEMEMARFIIGERELTEASFAEFQAELAQLGAPRLVEIWQQVYDGRAQHQ